MSPNSKPVVIIDARCVSERQHGFSRYITALAQGLALRKQTLKYEPVFLIERGSLIPTVFQEFRTLMTDCPIHSKREIWEIPALLNKEKPALYHSPTFSGFITLPGFPKPSCPWIQTLHDLNHLTFGTRSQKSYYKWVVRPFANFARKLITVSLTSQAEIATWLKTPRQSIEVVYNAISPDLYSLKDPLALESAGVSSGKYFFCLSNSKPHKNLPLLLEAYAKYRTRVLEQNLGEPHRLLLNVPELSGADGICVMKDLKDSEVKSLMEDSAAVLFPSIYEGFGLPPVESAALGTGVLISDIPAHREALGWLQSDAVLWADPSQVEAWVQNLLKVHATQGGLRLTSEASAQVRERFSVEKMGVHMDRVYRTVLEIYQESSV